MEVSFAEGKMLEIVDGKSFYFECPGFAPTFLKAADISPEDQHIFKEFNSKVEALFNELCDKHFHRLEEQFKQLIEKHGDY